MPWNVDNAVATLQTNARASSAGYCARYVRDAIGAGGIALQRTRDAKDYGTSLVAAGFTRYDAMPEGGYKKGDVAVMQGFTSSPAGHMQMFDGSAWISDFKQNGFWAGPGYRTHKPAFKIYRHP
ncbi:cytoplasmic protein [Delftia tsuruhatensis]|uniref:hypothetical protein n=1 Tax=Delftia tsuruhatensis TaxID=180282 RepID=UPI000641B6B9|nr:hypothetical protein [Delftia tsuruhatensis]KLO56822.1 cytoplasmic protein [Delftia tsuruhatensis]